MLNFIGPNEGQGIAVYNDAVQIGHGTRKLGSGGDVPADGRIVLGRFYIERNNGYTSVYIDELYFYNHCLAEDEIIRLSQ